MNTNGPMWKKWWFWAIVAVLAVAAIGSGLGEPNTDVATTPPVTEAPAATAPESAPPTEPEAPLAEEPSMAQQAYLAIEPVEGEQIMTLDFESDEKYLMDRFMETVDANPEWEMVAEKRWIADGTHYIPYIFADGSRFIFAGVAMGGEGDGLKLESVEIED